MKANEKKAMIDLYKNQFNYYIQSNDSDYERLQVNAMKQMLNLFFSKKEIMDIENSVRITNEYVKGYFENIESWLRQIEKEQQIEAVIFSWDNKGLELIEDQYDWLYNTNNDYKGLKLAMDFAYKVINKEAA